MNPPIVAVAHVEEYMRQFLPRMERGSAVSESLQKHAGFR